MTRGTSITGAVVLALAIVLGCDSDLSPSERVEGVTPAENGVSRAAEPPRHDSKPAKAATTQATRPASITTPKDAMAAAQEFLAKEKVDWGQPEEVRKEDGSFKVQYPTPASEEAALGPRTLTVQKSGNVEYEMRR